MHVHTLTYTHTQTHIENYLCITYNIYSLPCLCTLILLTMCFDTEILKLSNVISIFLKKIFSFDAIVKCLTRFVPVVLKKKKSYRPQHFSPNFSLLNFRRYWFLCDKVHVTILNKKRQKFKQMHQKTRYTNR